MPAPKSPSCRTLRSTALSSTTALQVAPFFASNFIQVRLLRSLAFRRAKYLIKIAVIYRQSP